MNNNDAGYVNYETIIYSVGRVGYCIDEVHGTLRQSILRLDITLQLYATFNGLDLTNHYGNYLSYACMTP